MIDKDAQLHLLVHVGYGGTVIPLLLYEYSGRQPRYITIYTFLPTSAHSAPTSSTMNKNGRTCLEPEAVEMTQNVIDAWMSESIRKCAHKRIYCYALKVRVIVMHSKRVYFISSLYLSRSQYSLIRWIYIGRLESCLECGINRSSVSVTAQIHQG